MARKVEPVVRADGGAELHADGVTVRVVLDDPAVVEVVVGSTTADFVRISHNRVIVFEELPTDEQRAAIEAGRAREAATVDEDARIVEAVRAATEGLDDPALVADRAAKVAAREARAIIDEQAGASEVRTEPEPPL